MNWKASVLVIANRTADSPELLDALRARADRGPTAFTLIVPSRAGGRAAAEQTLGAALEQMRGASLQVDGQVGDSDPLVAVDEAWDPRQFDEVIVSTFPTNCSRWLQIDLPHRIATLTGATVKHVVAGPWPDDGQARAGVRSAAGIRG